MKIIRNQVDCNDSSVYGVKILSENVIIVGSNVTNDAKTGSIIPTSVVNVRNICFSSATKVLYYFLIPFSLDEI